MEPLKICAYEEITKSVDIQKIFIGEKNKVQELECPGCLIKLERDDLIVKSNSESIE